MKSIAFIDTEVEPRSGKVLDLGSVKDDGSYVHTPSVAALIRFLHGTQFIGGHNIINHDIKYIEKALHHAGVDPANIIDTLPLSPLLFPTKPYHALVKDDKLQSEETNNPLNDAIKACDLFNDEVAAFSRTDETLKHIFFLLLYREKEFQAFFRFVGYTCNHTGPEKLIRQQFGHAICNQADLEQIASTHPVALAYCLALIHSFVQHKSIHSVTPPWVLKNYPEVERIMFRLRNNPCLGGCVYCNNALDIHKAKGKEFDNVFLMLEDFYPKTDEARRQLYVAMTRAKQNLSIHLNTAFLDKLSADDLQRRDNSETFSPPTELVMHLTFKDVWLDYFVKRQYLVSRLQSGDDLMVDGEGCFNTKGQSVLKFSKDFIKRTESLKENYYELKSAKVNFIVYWLKEGKEKETMVVLPELYFNKTTVLYGP